MPHCGGHRQPRLHTPVPHGSSTASVRLFNVSRGGAKGPRRLTRSTALPPSSQALRAPALEALRVAGQLAFTSGDCSDDDRRGELHLDIYRSLAPLFTRSITRGLKWDGSDRWRGVKHGFGSHTRTARRKRAPLPGRQITIDSIGDERYGSAHHRSPVDQGASSLN